VLLGHLESIDGDVVSSLAPRSLDPGRSVFEGGVLQVQSFSWEVGLGLLHECAELVDLTLPGLAALSIDVADLEVVLEHLHLIIVRLRRGSVQSHMLTLMQAEPGELVAIDLLLDNNVLLIKLHVRMILLQAASIERCGVNRLHRAASKDITIMVQHHCGFLLMEGLLLGLFADRN